MQSKVKLSPWILGSKENGEDHCAMRVIADSDPSVISNRRAFIEKSPRVLNVSTNEWIFGSGDSEYGQSKSSREWADRQLRKMGYKLTRTNYKKQ